MEVHVPTLKEIQKKLSDPVYQRALAIHRENGHPEGYDGPCWGPTILELEEAAAQGEGV